MPGRRWTREETELALNLYGRVSFGQMHQHNPDVVALAGAMERTPSSIAMKLGNFASLDPAITRTGRVGLDGATALDRKVWAEFHEV